VRLEQLERLSISIGELSRLSGVSIETIRYYEKIELIPRPSRTRGGRRAFSTENCRTVAFIKHGRELGFSIPDIRTLLSLRQASGPCKDAKAVAERHLKSVQEKLRHLVLAEQFLSTAIASCSGGSTASCTVLGALDTGCCQSAVPALLRKVRRYSAKIR
jgi:MerR family transcriptional regulator, mercuric resistance operon regulatory protein